MDEYLAIMRWLHIGFGIVWIGLLYYFNFVQVPSFAQMDATARQTAIRFLVSRGMLWFRWAALLTALAGILWIVGVLNHSSLGPTYFQSAQWKSIAVGGTIGLIMFANVWLIIWPNWKKVIEATTNTLVNQTPAPPDQPKWARTAFLASRTNTMLSIPMLFFMIASSHLGSLWAR